MFQLIAGLLAFFYGLIPNYAIAIALLTLTVMLVLSPLTIKSTRSMLAMQKLQPEMKRLQQKYKGGDRQKLNEEMMALYKEHKVNPLSGCLPLLLQMPVFLVMYQVIRGLSHPGGTGDFAPKYLDKGTELYQDLVQSGGEMEAFGVDLAKSATQGHGSFGVALPFFAIVAAVVFVQYYQSRQMTRRSAASGTPANPQMQMMTKVLPIVFGVISLGIAAGVNIYFLVSGVFRIAQQGAMYRFDPALAAHVRGQAKEVEAKVVEADSKNGKTRGKKAGKAPSPDGRGKGATAAKSGKAAAKAKGAKGQPAKGAAKPRPVPKARSNGGRSKNKRRAKKGR